MNSSVYTLERAASPWMLGASVIVHGFLILGLVLVSTGVFKPPKPPEKPITNVTLVAPPGPPAPLKIQSEATKEPQSVASEQIQRVVAPDKAESRKRSTVAAKTVASKPPETIPVKKRKRKPKPVELPKEEPKKEPPKKREDPQNYLKERLKAIGERVKRKNPQTASVTPPATANDATRPGAFGHEADADLTHEQLAQWFNGIRAKVNAHWTVFQDGRTVDRVTVVGVQIADNGKLLGAAVDESSGDPVFDRSAMRAVFQADPFPPVPPKIREKIRQEGGLALRFTPGGMQ
ncbi:MAG: energy transducer TonB [Desulfomonilaceae bacterium]|nr:energy transducer TonB [Desulfomonilaceae bacterium]